MSDAVLAQSSGALSAPGHSPILAHGRPIRALILDDNAFDRRRMIRACKKGGVVAEFGEAVSLQCLPEVLGAARYDVVFVDYLLGDGTGLEAATRILAHPDHKFSALIMIAGQGDVDVARKALKTGCSDYIEKSDVSPDTIRKAVTQALAQSGVAQPDLVDNSDWTPIREALQQMATDCETDINPTLMRIMRRLQSVPSHPASQANQKLAQSCQDLRSVLARLEAYSRLH